VERLGCRERDAGQCGIGADGDAYFTYVVSNVYGSDKEPGAGRIFSSAGGQWGVGLHDADLRFIPYGVDDYTATNMPVSAGVWSHVAVASSSENYISYYVNGTWVQAIAAAQVTLQNTDVNWFIASRGAGERFDGCIDEVRIYDSELLDSMIARLSVAAPPKGFVFTVR